MSRPSEAAVLAVARADSPDPGGHAPLDVYVRLLGVAHDPALGLNRSVCLHDVVDALRDSMHRGEDDAYADFVARKFGSA